MLLLNLRRGCVHLETVSQGEVIPDHPCHIVQGCLLKMHIIRQGMRMMMMINIILTGNYSVLYVLGTALNPLQEITHSGYYSYPHFTDEKLEAQRSHLRRSHTQPLHQQGQVKLPPDSQAQTLTLLPRSLSSFCVYVPWSLLAI